MVVLLPLCWAGASLAQGTEEKGIRGLTVGPIENSYHPGHGYGSPAFERSLVEAESMGATWIALTPFGRVNDLSAKGVDPTFEKPFRENREDVARAVKMAHAHNLKVMLVPHLWVESGGWRAELDPLTEGGWEAWTRSYRKFVLAWGAVAEQTHVEMMSTGVELRFWVTGPKAPKFAAIVRELRHVYHGTLTYSANWDDAEHTVIWGEVDVMGINAFYPLAPHDGASMAEMRTGGANVVAKVRALADAWRRPVLFTEVGYTTRSNPSVRPWEWPDGMQNVTIDPLAQAQAYDALLAPLLDEPQFMGFFVWRVYSDPDDVSQEAEWGFSPRGKPAELVIRDAFATSWASDKTGVRGWGRRAVTPGIWP